MRVCLVLLACVLISCSSNKSETKTSADQPGAANQQDYLAKAAAEPGAVKTASGLVYKEMRAGTGASPKASDMVTVNYKGSLTDGTEFDSSYKRNEPATFPLGGVIPCWTEGVQMMKIGGKAQLVCPAAIGYGERGSPHVIPGGATLIFEVELLGIGPAWFICAFASLRPPRETFHVVIPTCASIQAYSNAESLSRS